jgi:predicted RNA-binding protein with TRAM domain
MEETCMMEIPDQLRCLFSAQIEERDGSYVVEIPEREHRLGNVSEGGTYRVAVLSHPGESDTEAEPNRARGPQEAPVEQGETREVEVETIGDQGDGIVRVERGYVVIVPDTERGERVAIEITDVRQNVAFAEVVERLSYYE